MIPHKGSCIFLLNKPGHSRSQNGPRILGDNMEAIPYKTVNMNTMECRRCCDKLRWVHKAKVRKDLLDWRRLEQFLSKYRDYVQMLNA